MHKSLNELLEMFHKHAEKTDNSITPALAKAYKQGAKDFVDFHEAKEHEFLSAKLQQDMQEAEARRKKRRQEEEDEAERQRRRRSEESSSSSSDFSFGSGGFGGLGGFGGGGDWSGGGGSFDGGGASSSW